MTPHERSPAPVTSPARAQIDADALHAAVARQRAQDEAHPPSRHLSKMAAVRIVADLITVRREHGWTDAQIVALLGEQLGVDITVGTLRVYVHRLRTEGTLAKKPDGRLAPAPALTQAALGNQDRTAETQVSVGNAAPIAVDRNSLTSPAPSAVEPVERTDREAAAKPAARFSPLTILDEDL